MARSRSLAASAAGRIQASTSLTRCRRQGNNRHVMPRNAIAILALAALISPLGGLRLQTSDESKSVWDGVYTEEQAKRGEPIYHKECAACHGDMLTGGESAPPLTGGAFLAKWNGLAGGGLIYRSSKNTPPAAPVRT